MFAASSAVAQAKKKKQIPAAIDSVEKVTAESLLDLFAQEKFADMLERAEGYLKVYPLDTVVRMRYGLANLYTQKSALAFDEIDKLLQQKDSAIKFYSILPLISETAAEAKIFDTLVQHCKKLDSTHIYTKFCDALYQRNFGKKENAIAKAKLMHGQITNATDAANLGSFLPSLLLANAATADTAMLLLQDLDKQWKDLSNIKIMIYQQAKAKANYDLACKKLDELMLLEPGNSDYVDDRIDIAIKLEDVNTACKLISTINADANADAKNLLVKCPKEMSKLPLKDKTQYVFNVNDKKKFIKLNVVLDANSETTLLLNYNLDGDAKQTSSRAINVQLFDSALRSEVRLYNNAADDSAVLFLWMSRAAMREIAQNKTIKLDFGKGYGTFDLISHEIESLDENVFAERVLMPDGSSKLVNTIHLLNYDTGEHVWINNDYNNPLIVKLESDYSFKLIQVK
jgi:hypothetical protein